MNSHNPHTFIAVYLILERAGEVLLLKRHNTGWADGKYSLIAGHLEAGERLTECVVREAFEEVGVQITEEALQFVHVMQRKDEKVYLDFFFTAREWKGALQNKEPNKCSELLWANKEELPTDVLEHVRYVLMNLSTSFSEQGYIC